MRTPSRPVFLSSMILASLLIQAHAQDVQTGKQAGKKKPATSEQTQDTTDRRRFPGRILEPTLDDPGLVLGVKLGEMYTDNLRLGGEGQTKESSFITTVNPFVMVAYDGPRLSGVLDYSLTGYLYEGNETGHQFAQDLNARGQLMLIPRHFFLDGTATYSRAVINHRLPTGGGAAFLDNNRANVGTASLSPYWVQELGRVGTMTLRYTHGRVFYNRNGIRGAHGNRLAGISDITSDGASFSIISPREQTWGWQLLYQEQRLKPDHGDDLKFATARLGVSRRFGIHLRLLAHVGRENRYLPDGSVDKLGGKFWNVGFNWSDPRNTVELLGGHRFFGRSIQFSWSHRATLLTTRVAYEERPTNLNQQLLGLHPGTMRMRIRLPESSIPSLLQRRVYLMKRATVSAGLEMRTGKLSVTLYDESRDFFRLDGKDEKVADAHASWLIELGPFTSLTPTLGWQRYKFRDGQVNYTRYVQVAAAHQFDPANFITLEFRHTSRNAFSGRPGAHGYKVNVIYLKWTHLFKGI